MSSSAPKTTDDLAKEVLDEIRSKAHPDIPRQLVIDCYFHLKQYIAAGKLQQAKSAIRRLLDDRISQLDR